MKFFTIWDMELLTIGSMGIFVICMTLRSFFWTKDGADTEQKIWRLKSNDSEVLLGNEAYYLGNRALDDIHVKMKHSARIRLYLNVKPDRVVLTVTKGSVYIDDRLYQADCRRHVTLSEFSSIYLENTQIYFQKLSRNEVMKRC